MMPARSHARANDNAIFSTKASAAVRMALSAN
jgi:hypothetical protein